jgi:spermidine/putrescine transport system permease protein
LKNSIRLKGQREMTKASGYSTIGIQKLARKKNKESKIARTVLLLFSIFVYMFMYVPLFTMILMSFNNSKVQGIPIVGLTLQWYEELFSDHELWIALMRSFIVSIGSIAIAVIIGLCSAFLINRYHFPGKQVYKSLILLPLIIPGVILGIALLATFKLIGVNSSLFTVMIGHSTFVIPLIVFLLINRLDRLDPNFENASMDLGANKTQTFRYITIPLIGTALLGGSLLGFTLSFDEIILTYFLIGTKATLPVKIYQMIRIGFTPEINAIFTILLCFTLGMLYFTTKLFFKKDIKS